MDKIIYIFVLMIGFTFCTAVEAQGQRNGVTQVRQKNASKEGGSEKASAQSKNRVTYKQNYMKQVGDSLVVDMDIDMSKLDVPTNFAQILTPVIASEREEIELPKVYVQGQARNKAYIRELELDDRAYTEFENNLPYAVVKPKGLLNYHFAVAFEPWMTDAFLDVEEDLCGCGDESKIARSRIFEETTKEKVAIVADPPYRVNPRPSYIQPEVEVLKVRNELENAYLDFPRGQNEILPNYGHNQTELAKIDKMIRTISTNKDITVQGIYMEGFASPESSLKFNTELSAARAESMMKYFMNYSNLPANLFDTRTGGEDWDGLRKLLEDYPLSNKSEIFKLMTSIRDLDEREKAISKIGGGRPYKIMYEELYPKLRRVVCEVSYTVKDFSIEEAKENIAYAPQLLSLNEMYIVANTYEVGSPEFLKVFEVARVEFPDDPVANLNGAAAALSKNNLRDAEKFLKLADPTTPEYANNMGILQLLQDNYREAERLLKLAESSGLTDATANIRELRKKLANVNSRREAGITDDSESSDDAQAPPAPPQRRRSQQ